MYIYIYMGGGGGAYIWGWGRYNTSRYLVFGEYFDYVYIYIHTHALWALIMTTRNA